MLDRFITEEPLEKLQAVATREEVCALRRTCREVYVHEDMRTYMVQLTQKTRSTSEQSAQSGVSPRGTLALMRASQGYALVCGRDYVTPEDIKKVAVPVLAHRCIGGEGSEREKMLMIRELLDTVPVPTENWSRL